jgi:hypothetical protein
MKALEFLLAEFLSFSADSEQMDKAGNSIETINREKFGELT